VCGEQDEDDPVQLKEDRDIMEVRSLYLICREEFLSALSYKLVRPLTTHAQRTHRTHNTHTAHTHGS
jgi:hypothetical protein